MMRRFALAGLFLLLSACGLHPLYGGGGDSPVPGFSGRSKSRPIPGQQGWLVRTKLVDRLGEIGSADRALPARRHA